MKQVVTRRRLLQATSGGIAAAASLGLPSVLRAQDKYPSRPVNIVVPFATGGYNDRLARAFSPFLQAELGQPLVIVNQPGGGAQLGHTYALQQPNDGYTFVVGNLGPVAVNPLLSKVPYSIEKDFVPVSMISTGPNVLVVRTDSPFKSLAEIIDFAKKNPGKLNYGTSGPGSVSHLSSDVIGTLSSSVSLLHLGEAVHPTAAVGGTPRLDATTLIGQLEGMDRGRYAGPVGWIDGNGDGELGIALRCAQISGSTARLFAGCGLVADSDPDIEVQEAHAKMRPMREALEGL